MPYMKSYAHTTYGVVSWRLAGIETGTPHSAFFSLIRHILGTARINGDMLMTELDDESPDAGKQVLEAAVPEFENSSRVGRSEQETDTFALEEQPSKERRSKKIWPRAAIRGGAQNIARAASDAPLKVAQGLSTLARATSDGVASVAKKSVSLVKKASLEITPLRKKSRRRRDDDVEDDTEIETHEDDAENEGDEEEGNGEMDEEADTSVRGGVAKSMVFFLTKVVGVTLRQLLVATLVLLLFAVMATVFYWKNVVGNKCPTFLVIVWSSVAFVGGRAMEAYLAEQKLSVLAAGNEGPRRTKVPSKAKRRLPKAEKFTPQTFLASSNKRVKQAECNEDIRANLMTRLLQNPVYQHSKVLCDGDTNMSASNEPLIAQVVDPVFTLRGMDVFLMEMAEDELATHPFLTNNGLRDVPTFMINMVAQWGNLAVYYEMPSWFESWDALDENDNDPVDVKALKRFLSKDDDYRTSRIRLLPSVVEGPLPIRVLAPPKKDMNVEGKYTPCSWKKLDAEVTPAGKRLAPLLEMELDLVSTRAVRGMASLVKRYLPTISVDVAVVIQKPDGQIEDEPEACLCLWKFHHLDISGGAPLPDRCDVVVDQIDHPDVRRASELVQMTDEEISKLSAEVQS